MNSPASEVRSSSKVFYRENKLSLYGTEQDHLCESLPSVVKKYSNLELLFIIYEQSSYSNLV